MAIFYKICLLLIIIGGINWGLIGLFDMNAVAWICGGASTIFARAIFTIVGIAGLCSIPALFSSRKTSPRE